MIWNTKVTATAALVCLLLSSICYAKKKEEVDGANIRKLHAEISRLKKENKKLDKELSYVDSMTSEE